MELEKIEKYLRYLIEEIDKYVQDGIASNEEMIQFINEFSNFKKQVVKSDLPESLKNEIGNIEFDYRIKQFDQSFKFFFLTIITFGIWALVIRYKERNERVYVLRGIQNDLHRILREKIHS